MNYSVRRGRIQFIKLKMRSRRGRSRLGGGSGSVMENLTENLDESSVGDFNWNCMIRFALRKILFCRNKKEGLETVM